MVTIEKLHEEIISLRTEVKELNNKLNTSKPIMTAEEAAAFLSISLSTLHGYCSRGIIPYSKPNGKRTFFDREELIQWAKSNKKYSDEEIEDEALTYLQR